MHYYKFNIGDYASHTKYLTPLQDLAYRRLLDLYYLNEKPFTSDVLEIADSIGMNDCSTDVERVLAKYFTDDGNGWSNKRADEEISEYQKRGVDASAAGKASGEARKALKQLRIERPFNDRSTTVGKPLNQTVNTKQETVNNKHEPLWNGGNNSIKQLPEFATFWSVYPKKVAKNAAEKAFQKVRPDNGLMAVILASIELSAGSQDWQKENGKYVPNPATWLNGRRWEDECFAVDPAKGAV